MPGTAAVLLNLAEAPDCSGDVDSNGSVTVSDLLLVISLWGPCVMGCNADIDGDLVVGIQDLLMVLASWGPCPG